MKRATLLMAAIMALALLAVFSFYMAAELQEQQTETPAETSTGGEGATVRTEESPGFTDEASETSGYRVMVSEAANSLYVRIEIKLVGNGYVEFEKSFMLPWNAHLVSYNDDAEKHDVDLTVKVDGVTVRAKSLPKLFTSGAHVVKVECSSTKYLTEPTYVTAQLMFERQNARPSPTPLPVPISIIPINTDGALKGNGTMLILIIGIAAAIYILTRRR